MKYIIYMLVLISIAGCRFRSENKPALNREASLTQLGDLPENPFLLYAITSAIYPKDSITTVLYGNASAYAYAAMNTDGHYPAGAVLYEVTWKQQPDRQWFGANIPQTIQKTERVEVISTNKTRYTCFQGKIPRKVERSTDEAERTTFILGQKIAVSP
ncbi:cytochrome P460 family protein [Chitinophaga varians]|uniref:Cytochrome P460 family protein n=1 Tax=Chitinophaga varians TaxID=2202339 RepID=A0A847RSK4_9BACT|nr:cytochrome P460 family protein [Chitinophaga varians]NLR64784.1 cytochrome P460 family protein [Chitinophaga varians]